MLSKISILTCSSYVFAFGLHIAELPTVWTFHFLCISRVPS